MRLRELVMLTVALLIVGCGSQNEVDEFNKPAAYWYQKTVDAIGSGNLDKADEYYISLKSEHVHSPFVPTATLMLAQAHMHDEEYLLANFYLDEYLKRYADEKHYEYIEFMKLKAAFLGITDVYKDQKLILDTLAKAQTFRERYPGSRYLPLVNHLAIRLHMAQYLLNDNIAALYDRIGKPEAAKLYRAKNAGSLVKKADIKPPKQGIIGHIID